jgi:hypothetical protein
VANGSAISLDAMEVARALAYDLLSPVASAIAIASTGAATGGRLTVIAGSFIPW